MTARRTARTAVLAVLAVLAAGLAACGASSGDDGEALIGPAVDIYERKAGGDVKMRYGDSPSLSATLVEEGKNSRADLFYAQDAGSLDAIEKAGNLERLPADILNKVPARFRSRDGRWVGVTGRSRVIAYGEKVKASELPDSPLELAEPKWKGRVGWAQVFDSNVPIRDAIAKGEIDLGLLNHYYVAEAQAEDPDYPVNVHYPTKDLGSLINVAGVGVLASSTRKEEAIEFVRTMLERPAQEYFAESSKEYPLASGVEPAKELTPLDEIPAPDIDLADLGDLKGTLDLMRDTGAL
jgi:iron(III) transport system substrate-binding protein